MQGIFKFNATISTAKLTLALLECYTNFGTVKLTLALLRLQSSVKITEFC